MKFLSSTHLEGSHSRSHFWRQFALQNATFELVLRIGYPSYCMTVVHSCEAAMKFLSSLHLEGSHLR